MENVWRGLKLILYVGKWVSVTDNIDSHMQSISAINGNQQFEYIFEDLGTTPCPRGAHHCLKVKKKRNKKDTNYYFVQAKTD